MKNANLVSRFLRTVAVCGAVLSLTACGQSDEKNISLSSTDRKTVADYFPVEIGGRTLNLQFAVSAEEMQRGLMGRRNLQTDQGMIFVYLRTQQMSFWMRNTPTPLDIGFFTADGVLREVYPLYPFDETTVRSRSHELAFAVETVQGWYESAGIKPGDKIDLDAVRAAMEARGFDLNKFETL